ncbi:hypothetical protein CRYUN_Cryun01aG0044100 [Craigia yunnanensis]
MGSCFSARIKAESPLHIGANSRYGGKYGNEISGSSSRISSVSVPRTEGEILQSSNLKSFNFSEQRTATRNFRPDSVLGEEINYLGQLYHPNLVKLVGYCLEDNHWFLVYEFMPKGSLENHLFRRNSYFQPLSWNLRMKVALGAAKGLAFLHSDEAKDGPTGDKSHVSPRVMGGTSGYAAPEYMATVVKALEQLQDSGDKGGPRNAAVHNSSQSSRNAPKYQRKNANDICNGTSISFPRSSASPLKILTLSQLVHGANFTNQNFDAS